MIHIGHSPDPDDAFMFYALAFAKFDTTPEIYAHNLVDIETLNREAERGKYEVTAISFHAYAYIADKYVLLPHGASFGDNYGPILVSPRGVSGNSQFTSPKPQAPSRKSQVPSPKSQATSHQPPATSHQSPATSHQPQNWRSFDAARQWLTGKTIAVPGTRTSAFLGLHLFAGTVPEKDEKFKTVVVPFDQIIPKVVAGEYDGGLIIHEGQLTYHEAKLQKIVDIGEWWAAQTGLPLPLGGNGIRRDLGAERIARISAHLRQSIEWGLAHRDETLGYALRYARDMNKEKADRFVGMYVNDYTLDYGEKGRAAVRRFLEDGYKAGIIKTPIQIQPEWSVT
ncbi:MAG: MqnA/MqnD/SBP family protein [Planctomycetota bacterium]